MRRTMWSKPSIWIGLAMRASLAPPQIGRAGLEQKPEQPAVAPLAVAQDMAAQQAFLLEAELLQQAVGAAVAPGGAGPQPPKAERCGVGGGGPPGLPGAAATPAAAAPPQPPPPR